MKKSSPSKKGRPKRTPTSDIYFRCNLCDFTTETLGELKIHKHGNHRNNPAPNYLDMGEAAVAKLDEKNGSSKTTILRTIMADYNVQQHIQKARPALHRALEGGVRIGRLRKGGQGKK